jgi:hypothetical protein
MPSTVITLAHKLANTKYKDGISCSLVALCHTLLTLHGNVGNFEVHFFHGSVFFFI